MPSTCPGHPTVLQLIILRVIFDDEYKLSDILYMSTNLNCTAGSILADSVYLCICVSVCSQGHTVEQLLEALRY
jgi:hypothetical protein